MSEAPSSSPSTSEPDWTDQVTDLVVDTVEQVKALTVGQLIFVTRLVTYGLLGLFVAAVVGVLVIILLSRLLDLLPGDLWTAYTGFGLVLVIAGRWSWKFREKVSK